MSHSPRPILKRSSAAPSPSPHAVHFPPSPSLTTHTFTAYSSAAYDRSPIQVSPNSCALPERGCPGRTYTLDEHPTPRERDHRRYYSSRGLHPRAIAKCPSPSSPPSSSTIPSLIPDLSSESDESDHFISPPTDAYQDRDSYPYTMPLPISPSALAFLPHAPSSYSIDDDEPSSSPKHRRRRRHDVSTAIVPERIPDAPYDSSAYPYDTPIIRTPTKKRVPALSRALTPRHSVVSSFRVEEDGCLGGF